MTEKDLVDKTMIDASTSDYPSLFDPVYMYSSNRESKGLLTKNIPTTQKTFSFKRNVKSIKR